MGRIRILEPQVAAQIAAGEVITRPAAAVKELVENALDAGARHITVEIEEGGRRRLTVVDDGCGMSREEAPLSLERHATSKIRAESDLLAIDTLGFRGEALPSIAAISRFTLITRPPQAEVACRVAALAGAVQETAPGAGPPGTQVTVEDLFFNTPVRRKFLKSRDAEQAYIVETLRQLALGYPEVHFLLKTPARTLLAAPASQTLLERVAALFGPDLAAHLLPFAWDSGGWQVEGLLSVPEYSLASSRFQVFLVNRRVVHDRLLGAVLKELYQGLLPRGRHPAAVVLLTLPPGLVDVNVHPAKAEVRFQEPGRVYALLLNAMRQGLGREGEAKTSYTLTWQPESLALAQDVAAAPPPGEAFPGPAVSYPQPPPVAGTPRLTPPQAPALVDFTCRFQDLGLIGQLQSTYILAQSPQGLVLIDQHAAHERVLYETLKAQGTAVLRQALLFPRVVEVSPRQADWVAANLAILAQAGLDISPFGGASFLISGVPACLAGADPEALVLEMVDTLSPLKGEGEPESLKERACTIMACHGAIRAGQTLSREEMQALLQQLDDAPVSSHCPHGRPVWRLIPYADIRQGFRRPRG
jgi:DNA mismatch repair protein MutL